MISNPNGYLFQMVIFQFIADLFSRTFPKDQKCLFMVCNCMDKILTSSMHADDLRILPALSYPCRKIDYRGDSRKNLHFISVFFQNIRQLFCPAVKSGIPGKQHRTSGLFLLLIQDRSDLFRQILCIAAFLFFPESFQHPHGSDQHITFRNDPSDLFCKRSFASHPDPDKIYPAFSVFHSYSSNR